MAFNTVGIQDNLPVQPIHVLQLIQTLTFSGEYAAEAIYRQGRTNFGASAFTSSAHVEMHSYNGVDPLVVYSGPTDANQVLKVDSTGATTITTLTGSEASITSASVSRAVISNAIIANESVVASTISTANIASAVVSNGVITTLNGTVGAITTFTASNASVTNTISASNLYAGALTSPSATITTGNITTGVINNLTTSTGSIGLLSTTNATVANNLGVTNNVAVGSKLSVTGSTAIVGDLNVGGVITGSQATINYTNTDYINANGDNSHIKLNNPSATGQTAISYVIDGKLTGKLRSDYVGNMQYVTSGSGNHYFFTQGDFPDGGVRMMVSSSGRVGIGTSTPTTTLEVAGAVKAASFTGSFTGSLSGSFAGTTATASYVETAQTASYVALTAGPGITVNGLAITSSVRSVNGVFPASNGNIQVALSATKTGTSASLQASASGAITSSLADGLVWIISNNTPDPTKNGTVYIYASASVGAWYQIEAPGAASNDLAYIRLDGTNTVTANLNFGGYGVTNAGFWSGSAATASFVTGSNVRGPHGFNSVVTASNAITASFATTSSFAVSASWAPPVTVSTASFITTGSISTTQAITGSLRVTGSLTLTATTTANRSILVSPGAGLGIAAQNIYPYGGVDFSNFASNYPGFAHFRSSNTGQSQLNAGGVDYYWTDINLGPRVTGAKAGSIKIATDTGNVSPTSTITYTLVSHGSNVSDNDTNWKTANGRDHALTVSGSMLARDGVSLGTSLTNSHIITGSVNMTGSFTLNGSNLSTLVSPVQSATVDLSQSDILNLGTTPVTLVPAPGIGKYISVVQTTLYYKANTAPYTANTAIAVLNGNFILLSNSLLGNTSDYIAIAPGATSNQISSNSQFGYPASAFVNQTVYVSAPNGINPAGGNGTMRVRVLYTIENVL